MNELALFAGAGGGILGGKLLGWRTVCGVERDAYAAQVLAQRQNDGILEPFPIWSDVTSFDGKPWAGIVDVVSGGFPCQDISAAGKGAGITGERSGLWTEFARIISEVRPRYAFVENSPMLTIRGLGVVLSDLSKMGFNAEWGVLSAADVGAKHERERIWILAEQRNILSHTYNRNEWGEQQQESTSKASIETSNALCSNRGGERRGKRCNGYSKREWHLHTSFNKPEPIRMVNGVGNRVDRLKAIGNGQVPLCAATAFTLLKERLNNAP